MIFRKYLFYISLFCCLSIAITSISWESDNSVALKGTSLNLRWENKSKGWKFAAIQVKDKKRWIDMPVPDGGYTLLYAATKPPITDSVLFIDGKKVDFPEFIYRYAVSHWKGVISPVQLNTAGEAHYFYPKKVAQAIDKSLVFSDESGFAKMKSEWKIDPKYPTDVLVTLTLTANKEGYFSIASPTLANISKDQLAWGLIPGYFQGAMVEADFVKAYAYGQGIPDRPVIVRERAASTLSPLMSLKNGITMAVIPDPSVGRNPWEKDKSTHTEWKVGLSLMNRKSQLSPTIYHPVLGEKGSYLKKGESTTFTFRYSLQAKGWYDVFKHAVNDIYRFKDFLSLKQTAQSLTDRISAMHTYLMDSKTSMWKTEQYKGLTIGAQAYLGGVLGSEKDAMKNSDYGAMWMIAKIANDSALKADRLPYARNFKLLQQEDEPGFLQGAAIGQYYLTKSKKFTEEWGPYVEPIGLTYYTMMDIGNVLLFEPQDKELKNRLKQGAERLMKWQNPSGGWVVAYDRATHKQLFNELEDLRPTFYGLVIAYRILGDKKYLDAAVKGADWYIKNAVDKGHFLGVCGDARFVPDFATGQSVQALLDLYDLTKKDSYLNAAIKTARYYTTSIYTHPIPTKEFKTVKGIKREDWEVSQVGLSFEHGGNIGSTNSLGPILLASHAGMFVRMYNLTKDQIYLDMARAAAWGRDAFVDKNTNVASYYWTAMNAGPGSFPHHAWWQIGWITDYLMAEVELRSQNQIIFPRGFITPKVGPHQSYGFAPGKVYGNIASLKLIDGLLKAEHPTVDHVIAINSDEKKCYLMLLNNSVNSLKTKVEVHTEKIPGASAAKIKSAAFIGADGKKGAKIDTSKSLNIEFAPNGLKVIEVLY
ncbi:beta-L-arabinofuranosidase domain-containing protein [Pedobacter sp. ASV1-7]|uniref:beta-L-arabinofuranosidase domain-containing protein n=1 Tax=Pedobacter sp. ASV1-7 TaxID=3145237 RepID=UPI0032E85B8B